MADNTKSFDTGDKLFKLFAPILSAALFAGLTIGLDYSSGAKIDFLSAQYLLKISLSAAAGALLSGAIYGSRTIIEHAQHAKKNYLQLPWKSDARSSVSQSVKLDTIRSLAEFYEILETRVENKKSEELALQLINVQTRDQIENLLEDGRLQFISPKIKNTSINQNRSGGAQFQGDGYGLIKAEAKKGDLIQASDFQNSNYWWLDRRVAFQFFEMNIELLLKGVRIERIFGRHHPEWQEDESGLKQKIIDLQSRMEGMDIYSINYADFLKNDIYDIIPIDQLALLRGDQLFPSLEWKVDQRGETDKVYCVFGEKRLAEMHRNFENIKKSGDRGSSLTFHERKKDINVHKLADRRKALKIFGQIIDSVK